MSMAQKLSQIAAKYEDLQSQMLDPALGNNPKQMMLINKEMKQLEDAYRLHQLLKQCEADKLDAKQTLAGETDPDVIELAKAQLAEAEEKELTLQEDLKVALLPKDLNDDKNIFLEVRPAAWGDEAGLFGEELLRMYLRYAERSGWKAEIIEHEMTGIGGLKIAIVKISWDHIYSKLKFESGVHRVQRIPDTESNGRIHTSTVTVAVMPEVEDVEVEVNPNDVQMDTYAASSAGGQNANKNQTGVRLHHIPTGLMVNIWDSKSQMQNKEKARAVLKARLFQIENDKHMADQKEKRLDQVGSWDRSEKIRTYNFPQDRVTDHRVKESWSNLPAIMDGDIEDIMLKMIVENQRMLLESTSEE